MKEWSQKGCEQCRAAWETGRFMRQLAFNYQRQAALFRCPACKSYREEFDRYADIIPPAEVKVHYPDVTVE